MAAATPPRGQNSLAEQETYDGLHYHAEGDIPERCDVSNAALTVKATLAAVLTLDQEQ